MNYQTTPAAQAFDQDIEQALLGLLITRNDFYLHISDILKPENFYFPFHNLLYETISHQLDNGQSSTPEILIKRLKDNPLFIEANGREYISGLLTSFMVGTAGSIRQHAQEIKLYYLKRTIFNLSQNWSLAATSDTVDVSDLLSRITLDMSELQAEQKITKILEAGLVSDYNFQSIPKRQFLYGNFLIRRFCSATISPGGVGKTQLVMTDAVSLATGRALLKDMPHETVKAWHYNLEDPIDELQRRLAAICLNFHVKTEELKGQLFLNSGRDRRLIVLEKTKDGQYARPDADALYKAIKDNDISYLSIDPFVRVHQASENDNKDIDEVLNIFSQIANDTNCAIDLVHHTKKMGKESMAGNMEAARGASAIAGAVRSARTLQVMSDKEADLYGIEQKRRTWYVRVDSAKANMAAPSESADWFERKSVTLPNGNPVTQEEGDKVGVLQYWEPPKIGDGLDPAKIKELFKTIQDGDEEHGFYSTSAQASNYIIPIMEKLLEVNSVVARTLIRNWKKDGYLIEEMMVSNKDRKEKKALIVMKDPD